ncbi:sensor histidine kinase [Lentzea cavernae]|uniref:histidine kinase n=1 Tax=Lentzea cavernae TaxID=2020703 RepID=A0ABQ3MDJ9_9PSEU|nr:sensor domain-containing protein [Lentzea cavernae]GHH39160.1 histidine kinase [Lentzea cavernae]
MTDTGAPVPRRGRAWRTGLALRLRRLGWSLVLLLGAAAGAALATVWLTSTSLIVLGAGIPLTLLATVLVRWFADLHRGWAADRLGEPVDRSYLELPRSGWPSRSWTVLRDPASWRDWAWLVVNSITIWFTGGLSLVLFLLGVTALIYPVIYELTPPQVFRTPLGEGFRLDSVQKSFALVPIGAVLLALWYATSGPLTRLNALVMRSLLGPTEQVRLRARVAHLAATRAENIDTQASELRRIERDLHDGAQARLVSLGMSLGLAKQMLDHDPQAVQRMLSDAQTVTADALTELRDLVRGIHPPVLADRGLDGALRALALANPIKTTVVTDLPGRLPAPVESAAYFAVSEALSNAIKHAGASLVRIEVEFTPRSDVAGELVMRVTDDGRGGADVDAGNGLRGVARRLAAFDGTLTVHSPSGGPTEIRMSLPCASS